MKQGFRHYVTFMTLIAVASTSAAYQAEDRKTVPADNRPLDEKVYITLRDVINRGADLYNSGELSACYRLYEGSLITIRPLIDHRPDLQKAISAGIASAERDPLVWRRAFTLRTVLDKIRDEVNPKKVVKNKFPAPETDDKPLVQKKAIDKIPVDKEAETKKLTGNKAVEKKGTDKKNEDKQNENKTPPVKPGKPDKEKPVQNKETDKKTGDESGEDKLPFPRRAEKKAGGN